MPEMGQSLQKHLTHAMSAILQINTEIVHCNNCGNGGAPKAKVGEILANVADLKYCVVAASPDQTVDAEIWGRGGRHRKIQAARTLSFA